MSSERILQKDLYGFPVNVTREEQGQRLRCYKKSLKRQARDWAFETAHRHIPVSVGHEDMKRRCRKGIPTELRPFVWMEISGASQKKAMYASSYFVSTATSRPEGEPHEGHLKQIDLDVPRTFPEHAFFKSHQGQRALTMTLRAIAVHMPEVGYCQSLNYVAGLLLLVLDHDPEDAFWVLVVLIEDKLVPGTYDSGISGCLREVRVLERLLQRKMPAISKHLRKRDVDLIAVTPQWFLSLFAQDFPFETVVRVFDALLFEGSKILHRVALAMFKLTEPRLLQASDTMAVALSLRSATQHMHDRDFIMRTALRRVGSLPQATIDQLRASQQPDSLLSNLLSRITARKPAKPVPWNSMGNTVFTDGSPIGDDARDSLLGPGESSSLRPDMGMPSRRHSSSGLRITQQPAPLDRRSMDAPAPVDLLASMGGIGLLDTNADISSVATSPRSMHHGHTILHSSIDSQDPRNAQLMQVQAVLDHASIRREMEFTHNEAFNFTKVKVVKVAEAAKLSVHSPLLGGGVRLEEEGPQEEDAAVRSRGEGSNGDLQMAGLPPAAQLSDDSDATSRRPQRALSMHGDVRALLAAADERAAAGAARTSAMDRSSAGTGGTEGSPITVKLPYPPSHNCPGDSCSVCGHTDYEGAGVCAMLREAAGSGVAEGGEQCARKGGAVAEAARSGSSSMIAPHLPVAAQMQFVPAVAQEAAVAHPLAALQLSDFELDFQNFKQPQRSQEVRGQAVPMPGLAGAQSGIGKHPRFAQTNATQHVHSGGGIQRMDGLMPGAAAAGGSQRPQQPSTMPAQSTYAVVSASRLFQTVTPGEPPTSTRSASGSQPPHRSVQPARPGPRTASAQVGSREAAPEAQAGRAAAPDRGDSGATMPHNAYCSGMFPTPLLGGGGGGAAVPAHRVGGGLRPGVVHGLMPIEMLGAPAEPLPGMSPAHLPAEAAPAAARPAGARPPHDSSRLAPVPPWSNSVSLPPSTRMHGRISDSLFSHGYQSGATPRSGLSDVWYTAQEWPEGEASGIGSVGSHPSSLASSQPGQCGFPLRMCN